MPGLDRGVIHDELVLRLVLGASADLDGPLDEREGVLDLGEVGLSFQVLLSYFALLIKFKF